MNFAGVVLTDWDGGLRYGPPESVINAGVDVAMQPGNHEEFISRLKEAVLAGRVSGSRIDDAVERILRLKFKTGVFNEPLFSTSQVERVGQESSRLVARQAVRESLVLLKNDNTALPLSPDEKIHVAGEHGNNSGLQSGGWSIHWQGQTENYAGATTILSGIEAVSGNVTYSPTECPDDQEIDTAVVVVGEQPYAEHLGDTDQLWLREEHQQLIAGCRRVASELIVILISGRPLQITRQLEQADAFIAAWLPGSEGGGVADFLFSRDGFQPTGRLPHPWPKEVSDLPLEIGDPRALFPYGFGLQSF
jgi:beta-glucosidase